jgi:hypothetical protein
MEGILFRLRQRESYLPWNLPLLDSKRALFEQHNTTTPANSNPFLKRLSLAFVILCG